MKALAFANNDIAVIAWTADRKLDGCLGFAVYRVDMHAGTETALPAMARFEATAADAQATTAAAPVQKFWWKDLYAARETPYRYRIVAMGGKPGALEPLEGIEPLLTNTVVLTPKRGPFEAYFNRGIVASQAVARALGTPSAARLMRHIANPDDALRKQLTGQLFEGLTALLDRADKEDGEIRAALYELNDPEGLEVRLQAKDRGKPRSRAVVLGNELDGGGKGKAAVPDVDAKNRQALKDAGVAVADRILPDEHIPHNKFLIGKRNGAPVAVLTGSTNWTMNALAAQTNNALIVNNADVAALYQAYWDQLEKDTASGRAGSGYQTQDFRAWVKARNAEAIANPVVLKGEGEGDGAKVHLFFAPSTHGNWLPKARKREDPADMGFVFDLMRQAQHAILFLAFDPGNVSILDVAGEVLAKKAGLFVRGALTSEVRASNFEAALKGEKDAAAPPGHVAVIGEGGSHGTKAGEIDYRAIPAGHVDASDAFGAWEAELASAGHAIIHDKIVVIDPFSDDCVVVTGSHNLGYRASHNNDENFVVIAGHRGLAEAYACHVLDIYDHYSWRYWLHKDKGVAGKPLDPTPGWQDRYLKDGAPSSPELKFWLSAAGKR
jgi:phosphatidylserine/phosphatidylglycerophosphate/cardiolipin synthase-like enzyme